MTGTKTGGIKAAATNYERHGKDFYREIGRKGGLKCGPKGFARMPKEKVREAAYKGGCKSKRTKKWCGAGGSLGELGVRHN